MANGQNDLAFCYVGQDVRSKILQLWKEAETPQKIVLQHEKELGQAQDQIRATQKELLSFADGSAAAYEGQPDWDAIDKRRNYLNIAMHQEAAEVKRLSEQVLESEVPVNRLASRCAALLCHPFVEAIHEALPAELRDLVYDYLWDEDTIDHVDGQLALPYANDQDGRVSQDWILCAPFFTDANITGEAFAREAATYFFRMVTDAEIDYRLTRPYLRMANFGNMRFRPREIIRRLRIDLAWSLEYYALAYMDLRTNLESLLDLPIRDDFVVEVFLPRDMQYSRTLFHVLDVIKPIYHALVEKGMAIKVLGYRFFTPAWRQYADLRDEREPKVHCTTAELLNCYFEGTSQEWFAMKEAELATIKQPLRMQKCYEVLDIMQRNFENVGVLVWDGEASHVIWPDEPCPPYVRPGGLFG